MVTNILTVEIPKSSEQMANEYIDRVERRRARDAARAIRRYQRFMDTLWNCALCGAAVFFVFAAALAVASVI